jgi:hypothetical protein
MSQSEDRSSDRDQVDAARQDDRWTNNRAQVDALQAAVPASSKASRAEWLKLVEDGRNAERVHDRSDETEYLLDSPANAARLRASLDRARHGDTEGHDLVDD